MLILLAALLGSGTVRAAALTDLPAPVRKALTIHPVEHMDEVLKIALAVPDPSNFLEEGFHDLDEIYEVPRGPGNPTTDVPHPAGVN